MNYLEIFPFHLFICMFEEIELIIMNNEEEEEEKMFTIIFYVATFNI